MVESVLRPLAEAITGKRLRARKKLLVAPSTDRTVAGFGEMLWSLAQQATELRVKWTGGSRELTLLIGATAALHDLRPGRYLGFSGGSNSSTFRFSGGTSYEYLWGAAWNIFDEGDPAAETWVHDKALAVLQGKAGIIAAAIRRKATTSTSTPISEPTLTAPPTTSTTNAPTSTIPPR